MKNSKNRYGIKRDNVALYKQFNLRVKSMIDLEDIFKKLSSKNQLGAKKLLQ